MKQVCGIWFPEDDTHFKLGMIDEQGNYQRDIFDAAMSYVKEPKIFFDIGAHVGLWSLMAHRAGFETIHAFEPNPETFACLIKNVGDKAFLNPYGVSQYTKGVKIVRECKTNSGAVKLEDGNECFAYALNTRDIELPTSIAHTALIKIDTEGMEAECVLGMDKILYALHPVVCVEQRRNEDALNILQKMGMEIVQQVRKDYILTWKNQ